MRLEDVKPGMWVRTSNGDVGNVAGFDGPCVRVRFDGSDLRMAGEVAAARLVKRAAPGYYDGWLPGHGRRACIAIALALLL